MGMQTLRVLHCVAGNLFGGVETLLVTLARLQRLAPTMEPEFVICFEGRLSDELRRAGAVVHSLEPVTFRRPWTVWRARASCAGCLQRGRSMSWFATAAGHTCCSGRSSVARDSPWFTGCTSESAATIGSSAAQSRTPPDLTLVNSRGTLSTLPRLFPGAPKSSSIPPSTRRSVAHRRPATTCASELATSTTATVILQASRLERWKGHSLLLAALAHLRVQTGWVAWVAGGAQRPHERVYLTELQLQAHAAGIAARVRFLGERSDVPRLLAAADLLCQPNTGPEPFGVAFVEALYAQLPVVSTRIGGAAEIVDESCGRLVPPGDPSALAEILAHLIDDPTLRQRLGAAGPAPRPALVRSRGRPPPTRSLAPRRQHNGTGPLTTILGPMETTTEVRAIQSLGASHAAIYQMVARVVAGLGIEGGSLLDVGCGRGHLWLFIAPYLADYAGVDMRSL